MFKVLFKSGDSNWLEYEEISHLIVTDQYLKAMGIEKPSAHNGINLLLDTLASAMIETETHIFKGVSKWLGIYLTAMALISPADILLPPSNCPTPKWTKPDDDAVDYGDGDGSQPGEDMVTTLSNDADAEGDVVNDVKGAAANGDIPMDTTEEQAPIEAPIVSQAAASILAPMEIGVAALSIAAPTHVDVALAQPIKFIFPTFKKQSVAPIAVDVAMGDPTLPSRGRMATPTLSRAAKKMVRECVLGQIPALSFDSVKPAPAVAKKTVAPAPVKLSNTDHVDLLKPSLHNPVFPFLRLFHGPYGIYISAPPLAPSLRFTRFG